MTLEEAQKQVDQWVKTYGVRYFSELTNMAILTEEVGELARVMARKYGDQSFKAGEKDNLDDFFAVFLAVSFFSSFLPSDLVSFLAAAFLAGFLPSSKLYSSSKETTFSLTLALLRIWSTSFSSKTGAFRASIASLFLR